MVEWWNGLAGDLQLFYGIGILTTGLLILQLLLTLVGLGDSAEGLDFDTGDGVDGLGDSVGDVEHGTGLGLLSVRSVVAFLAGFGWTGALLRASGWGLILSVLLALIVGFLLMLMVFWLMRGLYSLRQDGTMNYRTAVGEVGTVYVTVPGAGADTGQIQVMVQGRLATVSAATNDSEPISSGSKVRVVGMSAANTLQVEKI